MMTYDLMEDITTYKAKWQIPNNNMHPISIDWDLKLCYVKLCENKEWPHEVVINGIIIGQVPRKEFVRNRILYASINMIQKQ